MKKILTFLVMLVASVSFLMAQAPQAKFNYQAVVRDRNHDNNLVMNRTIDVTIEILNGQTVVYTEPHTDVQTNRNGMVSFVINVPQGSAESANVSEVLPTINNQEQPNTPNISDLTPVQTQTIDWSNAVIRATFKEGNTVLSVVENDVMPVPYALSANVDPLEITTQKIVDYINDAETTGEDVGQIVTALLNKTAVSNAVRDSIISYIKTQPVKAKELAIYFLGTVTVNDAKQAFDTLTDEVKQEIKRILVDSIKANKALAYDIAADYLKHTTKTEVNELWSAARENPQFHEIFDAVRDSAITYIMNHKELVMNVAEYYIKNVLTYEDVRAIYDTLRDKNPNLYAQLKAKFDEYLASYVGENYVQACDGVTLCQLKEELDNAKAKAANCPYFLENPTATIENNLNTFAAQVENSNLEEIKTILTVSNADGPVFPYGNLTWTSVSTNSKLYQGTCNSGLAANAVVEFNLNKAGCPVVKKSVIVQ